ncbi:hypothetical protein SMITH_167 [Smithella sp. ME-1]|uniref:Uncharacterized protein n=1 Tax=hydrocarbon metagenome TaxID=938273 RepID=A0A0W8FTS9_9ZZZZ|nr:hypothetical protein SMITH_167 [Smithella sp. ME-1]
MFSTELLKKLFNATTKKTIVKMKCKTTGHTLLSTILN